MVPRSRLTAIRLVLSMARLVLPAAVVALTMTACGAGGSAAPVPIEDLTRDFTRAERRAGGNIDDAIRIEMAGPASDRRLAIVADAPARVTWSRRLPARARMATAVWLASGSGATARFGIADDRTYEIVAQVALTADGGSWRPFVIDLGRYGGWQWSLFYRPAETTWRLVFSVDATPGGAIAWHAPRLEARR
jgi:hypothetical protein